MSSKNLTKLSSNVVLFLTNFSLLFIYFIILQLIFNFIILKRLFEKKNVNVRSVDKIILNKTKRNKIFFFLSKLFSFVHFPEIFLKENLQENFFCKKKQINDKKFLSNIFFSCDFQKLEMSLTFRFWIKLFFFCFVQSVMNFNIL